MSIQEYVHRHVGALIDKVQQEATRAAGDASDESIHDLRVAIRRLSESLRVFEELFPRGAARKVRREIKSAMHLAGLVRNHDIATDLMRKAELVSGPEMAEKRTKAVEHLAAVLIDWSHGHVWQDWQNRLFGKSSKSAKSAAPVHAWKAEDSVEINAKLVLPGMAHDYFTAGRRIVLDAPEPAELHPFRLATKRIRYTLEMFRDIYGPSLAEKLDLLKPLQQTLGEVNDCVATEAAFQAGRIFRAYLERRAETKARAFASAWRTGFDRAGQEELWLDYLASVPAIGSSEAEAAVHGQHLSGDELRGG